MKKIILTVCLGLAVTACSQKQKENLGLSNVAPDEFAVVTRAPLSVPPDYGLRPPRPGTQRPMEISTRDDARQTIFGKGDVDGAGIAKTTSGSDSGFLAKTGANNANPNIRDVIDSEQAQGVEGTKTTTDKLLFWRDKEPSEVGTPIDPAEEYNRLRDEGVVATKKRNEEIPAP